MLLKVFKEENISGTLHAFVKPDRNFTELSRPQEPAQTNYG
jgi:hypothetical protein